MYDSVTYNFLGLFSKVQGLIVNLYFYDDENQIVVIYSDKNIYLLDISTMDILQTFQDKESHKPYNKLNATLFDDKK